MRTRLGAGLIRMTDLSGRTAVVTGASRGFGRAIATTLIGAGATVVGVSRTAGPSADGLETVLADATDPAVAAEVLGKHRPDVLVLNAGAVPAMGNLDDLSWAEFSRTWNVDTRHAFEWTRAALVLPLAPGSRIILMSSGAAVHGSPVSGGYAGAKATIAFLAAYANDESERRGLGLTFHAVQPKLTPATALGRAAVAAYAQRHGIGVDEFVARLGPAAGPDEVAAEVLSRC